MNDLADKAAQGPWFPCEIELVRNSYNIEKQELLNKIESAEFHAELFRKQLEKLKNETAEKDQYIKKINETCLVMAVRQCFYDTKEELEFAKKELAEKDAEIENLKKQVEDLKFELDEARDPVHCNLCGSCGVDMCCPAHGCAHPHIKSETLKEQSETILELYNELKEKDQVLAWYGDEGVYNWHYSDDKRTTTTTDVQEDFGKRAREVIQKYKVSEG